MRVFNQGDSYRVTVSEDEVDRFNDTWPCSELRGLRRGVSFTFDKRNGDLVDLSPSGEKYDGGALAALSRDAKAYGVKRLGLPE